MENIIALGIAFTAATVGLNIFLNKLKERENLKLPSLKLPFFRKEKFEEKAKEIDEKLEEVVSSGVRKESKEEVAGDMNIEKGIEKIVDESSENVKVEEDLLNEMMTTSNPKNDENEEEIRKPEIPKLPELNSDLEIDTEDIDSEFDLSEEKEEEKIDFDKKDDLIESLAKEVTVDEEEEIDLLRDLKGQKFDINELQMELIEVLEKLKSIKNKNQ